MDTNVSDTSYDLPERVDLTKKPRFLTEVYPEMQHDMEEWFYSYYFWTTWDGKAESLDTTAARTRAKAVARFEAFKQTNILKEATDLSSNLQYYRATAEGWWKYVNEMESAEELIQYMYDFELGKDPHSSAASNLKFIHGTLVPTLKSLGVPKEHILCITPNMTKAKWAVSSLRQIINNNGPNMEENLTSVMTAIADKSITVDVFREEFLPQVMGKESKKTLAPAQASVCMLPDGRELIIISSTPAHTRAIQMSTKSIAEGYGYTDPSYLITQVMKTIRPKDFSRHKYKSNEFGVLKISPEGGVYLPAVETFRDLAEAEYMKHQFYLSKKGEHILVLDELAFSYTIDDFVTALGYLNQGDAFDAILNMYAPTVADFKGYKILQSTLEIGMIEVLPGRPAYHLYLKMNIGE